MIRLRLCNVFIEKLPLSLVKANMARALCEALTMFRRHLLQIRFRDLPECGCHIPPIHPRCLVVQVLHQLPALCARVFPPRANTKLRVCLPPLPHERPEGADILLLRAGRPARITGLVIMRADAKLRRRRVVADVSALELRDPPPLKYPTLVNLPVFEVGGELDCVRVPPARQPHLGTDDTCRHRVGFDLEVCQERVDADEDVLHPLVGVLVPDEFRLPT